MMERIIAPSMLSADFSALGRDVEMVNRSEAGWFHLDIMDGVFVPNISFGFPVVKYIAKMARKPLDAHLMIVEPDRYIQRFADLGVQYLSVHQEACPHLHRTVQNIHAAGMKAGVAINPATPVSTLTDILCELDFALIMSVNPGFGGQSFIKHSFEKVKELRSMIDKGGYDCLIEIDGGVGESNVAALADAGVDAFVAGSSVFSAQDPEVAISRLKNL
jgi:ribulose-phosphate 3-epimerase